MKVPARLKPLRVLVAYGPTEEPLDPVRFLTNRSTGTMGRLLAAVARERGHRVRAVECPKDARTALQLERLLGRLWAVSDVLFMAAAVCDVRPRRVAPGKLRKSAIRSVSFVKNPDILAGLGRKKRPGQVLIGFAVESSDPVGNGRKKLISKKLEIIVAQKVTSNTDPFGEKAIEAWILGGRGAVRHAKSVDKRALSGLLIREAERIFAEKNR